MDSNINNNLSKNTIDPKKGVYLKDKNGDYQFQIKILTI